MDKGGIFLSRRLPIFYSALLLTGVNLLLRLVGTSFQVYLSGRIGPEGIGLLQLVLSVGSLSLVAGIGGVRTAAMYLTAEELGRNRRENVTHALSACFVYSILCSGCAALVLYRMAPWLADYWIGNAQTAGALRLLAAFLPVTCLCCVMTGYFTAANRIGTLAAVEVAEQLCSMGLTMLALKLWAGTSAVRACLCVILGSSLGNCLTLGCLMVLRQKEHPKAGTAPQIGKRLCRIALPLAAADILKAGISTAENLMVPKRLARNPAVSNPLASFGIVSGMTFPILMFPACILFGLAELLIPELARCAAGENKKRIRYLVRRSLKAALLYALGISGLLLFLAEPLCLRFYGNAEAALSLRRYAPLIPMLYCDAIIDAMTKGLGQQRACVGYNILTSAMDVGMLFVLLPRYGMQGYFLSFFVSHGVNFLLSLRRLLKITQVSLPVGIIGKALASTFLSCRIALRAPGAGMQCLLFLVLFGCLMWLLGVLTARDLAWLRGTLGTKKTEPGRRPDSVMLANYAFFFFLL